jgi:hypothetical protein
MKAENEASGISGVSEMAWLAWRRIIAGINESVAAININGGGMAIIMAKKENGIMGNSI